MTPKERMKYHQKRLINLNISDEDFGRIKFDIIARYAKSLEMIIENFEKNYIHNSKAQYQQAKSSAIALERIQELMKKVDKLEEELENKSSDIPKSSVSHYFYSAYGLNSLGQTISYSNGLYAFDSEDGKALSDNAFDYITKKCQSDNQNVINVNVVALNQV